MPSDSRDPSESTPGQTPIRVCEPKAGRGPHCGSTWQVIARRSAGGPAPARRACTPVHGRPAGGCSRSTPSTSESSARPIWCHKFTSLMDGVRRDRRDPSESTPGQGPIRRCASRRQVGDRIGARGELSLDVLPEAQPASRAPALQFTDDPLAGARAARRAPASQAHDQFGAIQFHIADGLTTFTTFTSPARGSMSLTSLMSSS